MPKRRLNADVLALAEIVAGDMPDRRRAFHVRRLAEKIDAAIVEWFLEIGAEIAPELYQDVTGRTSRRKRA